jgi:hypothetical protein
MTCGARKRVTRVEAGEGKWMPQKATSVRHGCSALSCLMLMREYLISLTCFAVKLEGERKETKNINILKAYSVRMLDDSSSPRRGKTHRKR